jgi:hypothetical protein
MGQTLTRRPISQQKSFATMGTPSSAFAPDQSQYQGFTTPQPSVSPDRSSDFADAYQLSDSQRLRAGIQSRSVGISRQAVHDGDVIGR